MSGPGPVAGPYLRIRPVEQSNQTLLLFGTQLATINLNTPASDV